MAALSSIPRACPRGKSAYPDLKDGATYLFVTNVQFEGELENIDPGGLVGTASFGSVSMALARAEIAADGGSIEFIKVGDVDPDKLAGNHVLVAAFPEDGVMIFATSH